MEPAAPDVEVHAALRLAQGAHGEPREVRALARRHALAQQ